MNEFYQEWIDSSLFCIEEAMGMAIECGHADDIENLEAAYDAIISCGDDEVTFALTAKGSAYIARQRSLERGRKAKAEYDRAYSMVRKGDNPYEGSLPSQWWLMDAAHKAYRSSVCEDNLTNIQRQLMVGYRQRGMGTHYQLAKCNYYNLKTSDYDTYTYKARYVRAVMRLFGGSDE